jgi:seryl-tRNA synthetase
MIDIAKLRQDPEAIKRSSQAKGHDINVDQILELDTRYRSLQGQVDELRHQRKSFDKDSIEAARKVKIKLKELEDQLNQAQIELNELLFTIPNPAEDFVPVGTEKDNQVVKTVGNVPEFSFKPKDHIELGLALDMLDFERAAKVSGSRFVMLKNDAVFLELSLVRYVFDLLRKKGFDLIIPPHFISSFAMRGMGYLEHGGDQETYYLEKDDLYLIGTSEHILGSMHAGETFRCEDLPVRLAGFSSCYRREAGSYGKDTKGMLRVHQFDKVEMFSFADPKKSKEEFLYLLSIEEEIMNALKLPYQVLLIASGDLGNPAAAKYDIETWMPGQKAYRETHSVSTTTDFQARRLNIKYRSKEGQTDYLHTLNGTAIAIGRMMIAIMENYQQEDGSIKIPDILVPYFGKESINATHN